MQTIMALIGGVIAYLLLTKVFGRIVSEEEMVARRLSHIEKKGTGTFVTQRESDLEQPLFDRTIRPLLERMGVGIRNVSGQMGGSNAAEAELQKQLDQAGSTMTASEYMALRMTLTLVSSVLGFLLFIMSSAPINNRLILLLICVAGPHIIMRYTLASKVTARQAYIERQLPDVLDLLSVSVEAGLGFEQAISYIVDNMEGPMVDELSIVAKEISMGRTRREAFLLLGERCGVETVQSFSNALVQSIEMGISMKVLLQTQAEAMRLHRKRVVEEKAMKISTKMLFPLVFFIFPAIFIVLLGPAIMNIMEALSGV